MWNPSLELNAPAYLHLIRAGSRWRLRALKNRAAKRCGHWRAARVYGFADWASSCAAREAGRYCAAPGLPGAPSLPLALTLLGPQFRGEGWADLVAGTAGPAAAPGWLVRHGAEEQVRGLVFSRNHGRFGAGYACNSSGSRAYFHRVFAQQAAAARFAMAAARAVAEQRNPHLAALRRGIARHFRQRHGGGGQARTCRRLLALLRAQRALLLAAQQRRLARADPNPSWQAPDAALEAGAEAATAPGGAHHAALAVASTAAAIMAGLEPRLSTHGELWERWRRLSQQSYVGLYPLVAQVAWLSERLRCAVLPGAAATVPHLYLCEVAEETGLAMVTLLEDGRCPTLARVAWQLGALVWTYCQQTPAAAPHWADIIADHTGYRVAASPASASARQALAD